MRSFNLRQVEAFRAVVESGTVSAAATHLHVTQPAVSKLLSQFEDHTGLRLFERVRGRLIVTPQGMRLYDEVDRIFAGLHQIERAVESVKREEHGQLIVGVLPALAGHFIRLATMRFLALHPNVFVSVKVRASAVLADWLATRQVDVGLLNTSVHHPELELEPFLQHPLVCLLPAGHRLTRKASVSVLDLEGEPFIAFDGSVAIRRVVDDLYARAGITPNYVLEATTAPTLCEFVAAGLGLSLVHPQMADTVSRGVVAKRFLPTVENHFLLGRAPGTRNARYVEDFLRATREVAGESS
ncbi:LysR substrate-binding domain-containing protein [Bordetella sp. BOR01]|uniref:LysR substrate-binding domain-containing protein n=1 Tax=Bordetella sp. BOR01 TaxID=2854779 RepID=UPI001C486B68|nr:LysR substrate-binding domain-containing protein [Bordetella sp. BOR01]MBV7482888.1 LysR family transcriptional regulator [Bordetella sp. BOR01]